MVNVNDDDNGVSDDNNDNNDYNLKPHNFKTSDMTYRELTASEIQNLERQGCRCSDWSSIEVADGFSARDIHHVTFDGHVRIGANCRMANIGILRTTDGATYGEGITISVLNEGGDGNLVFFRHLTSQLAALMVRNCHDDAFWHNMCEMIYREVSTTRPSCTTIGDGVTIADTRELTNVVVGNDCEITGAARLVDCTLQSTSEASILISDGVICDNCIIQAGASVTDFAKLYNTFVGEACHIGRGFTSENSAFFANSHMDNGESCAALCGPFSVSHHKSTLLIGGEYSFFNAGSGTNFSNHAYKMGPIHWGVLMRGSKTASGSHILWPAQIGAFSMVMGKVQTHPDARNMPFSYLIAQGDATFLVPGRNVTTVGTYRDVEKWVKRDRRPRNGRMSLVQYDWLNPLVVQQCVDGKKMLEQLQREQGQNVASYTYNGVTIRNASLQKGLRYYSLLIRLAMLEALEQHEASLPASTAGAGIWTDLLGMLAPESEISALVSEISQEELNDINDVADVLKDIHNAYAEHKWAWAYRVIQEQYNIDNITDIERTNMINTLTSARNEWLTAIRYDAEKEYQMGDVDEDILHDFIEKITTS